MIRGNLHLSSDLRRLGFIKVIVFLAHPSAFSYTPQLISKYRRVVLDYREDAGWNIGPDSEMKVAGRGIGKKKKPANADVIAKNHVLLARGLGFIRKDVNTWDIHGRRLSSMYTDDKGLPLSLNLQEREKLLRTKGLVADLSLGDQFIFSDSLLSADVDGIVPLIQCWDVNTKSKSELVEEYFRRVASWYERKLRIEVTTALRSLYMRQRSRFAKKGSEGGSSTLHREMQVEPRLNFLKDLGLVSRKRDGYSLSPMGNFLRDWFSAADDTQMRVLLDEKEKKWTFLLSNLYGEGLTELSDAQFDEIFFRMVTFYKSIGLILIPYESLYVSIAACALSLSLTLDFLKYEEQVKRLAKSRGVTYSTTVPGRRYVRA